MNVVIYGRGNSACFKKGYKLVAINTILSLCMLIMDRHRLQANNERKGLMTVRANMKKRN